MKRLKLAWGLLSLTFGALTGPVAAAETPAPADGSQVIQLPFRVENKGPMKAPAALKAQAGLRVTGQGFWKFTAPEGLMPMPEAARPFAKGAHATVLVDADRDTVYWGLAKVGWVAFSNQLSQSWVVKGDPVYASGNLHGSDILYRPGRLPLVAVADNEQGAVYLSDTTFQHATRLDWPNNGPYTNKHQYHPTDVAFVSQDLLYIEDGYGAAYLMPTKVDPFAFEGTFLGGKGVSQTPHGLTYNPADHTLLVSARPEAQIKRWSVAKGQVVETLGLPPGSTVCDTDVWGDYALAPCLDGPKQSPGPIYVVNLKKRTIVSTLQPKVDLGLTDAQHLHDAAFYWMPNGRHKDLYVIFTYWNPGGVAALKLVNVPDRTL